MRVMSTYCLLEARPWTRPKQTAITLGAVRDRNPRQLYRIVSRHAWTITVWTLAVICNNHVLLGIHVRLFDFAYYLQIVKYRTRERIGFVPICIG